MNSGGLVIAAVSACALAGVWNYRSRQSNECVRSSSGVSRLREVICTGRMCDAGPWLEWTCRFCGGGGVMAGFRLRVGLSCDVGLVDADRGFSRCR